MRQRSAANRMSRRLIATCAAVAAFILVTGCDDAAARRPPADQSTEAIDVSLGPVRIGTTWRTVSVTGTLFGEEEATIASKLSGRVEAVLADVGDLAPSGSVLARIETRDYELALLEAQAALASSLARLGISELPKADFDPETLPAVRRARAEAANAAAKLERAQQLYKEDPPVISEQEFNDVSTSHAVAIEEAESARLAAYALLADTRVQAVAVDIARKRVSDTTVAAPIHPDEARKVRYEVAQRFVSLGEYVNPGQAMFRLVAAEQILFRAEVPERYTGQVVPGQEVRVSIESDPTPFRGVVGRVSPRIQVASRTFTVEIRIDNADRLLKPGAFARGEIRLSEDDGVTFVPAEAVVTFAGVSRLFSVDEGKAKEHRVKVGVRVGDEVEIVGGLPVDQVIRTGAVGLANGTAVRVGHSVSSSQAP